MSTVVLENYIVPEHDKQERKTIYENEKWITAFNINAIRDY